MLYMCIYIHTYIYIFKEGEIKFADRLSKARFFFKNKLKQRGMYDVLKDLVFDEMSL